MLDPKSYKTYMEMALLTPKPKALVAKPENLAPLDISETPFVVNIDRHVINFANNDFIDF
uniref:Uncharacterized protein n=1 Tax=Romanomermis culicivorax TaxID=13658 RepID=A0A915KHQ7_ROMCU